MNDIVSTFHNKQDGQILKIFHDDISLNPREDFDQVSTIITDRKSNYVFSDVQVSSEEELEEWKSKNDVVLTFPLNCYKHSGMSLSISSGYPYNDQWDAGQIGEVVVTRKSMKEIWGISYLTKKNTEILTDAVKGEIEQLTQWLNGEVYGYELFETKTCNLNETHEKKIDACYGFYGYDPEENGISSHIPNFERFEKID
jgi:hypothetical protein